MEILPGIKDESLIDIMKSSKVLLSLWSRLSDCDYLALGRFRYGKGSIVLRNKDMDKDS